LTNCLLSMIMIQKMELKKMKLYNKIGIPVYGVIDGSPAAACGIKKGDYVLSVNGVYPKDIISYRYITAGERVRLKLRKQDGSVVKCVILKECDTDVGIIFNTDCFDGIRHCCNKCIFCFVDQLPLGLRTSLYVKDDDYRLSFLHGNFITLTNLRQADICRIIQFRLSPLYLSVHTTDPVLRGVMLGLKKEAPVLDQIAALAAGDITMHIQIVLCPGWNDGLALEQTIKDLAGFWPQVASVGIVPVGLTRFRQNLPALRSVTAPECRRLIATVSLYQQEFRINWGRSFVYLADEFYLKAGYSFPRYFEYDDFPQLENGIGLGRLFYEEFQQLLSTLPNRLWFQSRFLLATSRMGAKVLEPVVNRLNLIKGMDLKLIVIPNTFFGPRINVAALLTGRDLLWGLRLAAGENVLIPKVMLRQGTSLFLDGMSVADIERISGCSLHIIEPTAQALVKFLLEGRR